MVRLGLATTLLAAASYASAAHVHHKTPKVVPGAYIVEYEDSHDPTSILNTIKGDATIRKDIRHELFKGASFQFKDLDKAEDLANKVAAMSGVKAMYPVRRYSVPEHTVHSTGSSVQEVVAKRDTAKDTFTPHLMTQVNKFRDAGITGKGIKVAVIDTGIDYLHPALGGCFGPGCLVSYGADLVGDDFNGSNTPVPDDDPMDCQGHGTHVSGTIGGQTNNPYGIIGAASDVTLGAYRVFGCDGDVGNDILIEAYLKAYDDGSDIITASIGGASGWPEDSWAAVVSRIVEKGVPCLVSAGNSGDMGIFYASTAANGKKVTAVASVDNIIAPALLSEGTYSVAGSSLSTFGFTAGTPSAWGNVTLPVWAVNFNTADTANGCEAFPEDTPDLSKYITLIRRGSCTFVRKAQNAAAKGAKYIIYYNNAAGSTKVDISAVPGILGSAMVTAETGAAWIKGLQAGSEVIVNMADPETAPKNLNNFPNTATPGFLSTYTSWGPTYEIDVKPQISAPGGMILSTYPRALGSYAVLSGTSMACPLAAATWALVMQKRGTKDPKVLENLFSATAHPNLFNDGTKTYSMLAPVAQQGAGLIQAWDAANANVLLSRSSISFNDTEHIKPLQTFEVTNTGKKAVTYQLGHTSAATAYTFADATTIDPAAFPNELVENKATLVITPAKLTLGPGQKRTVTVLAIPPKGLDAKRLPVYSGYITLNGTDSTGYSLPYQGVVGSMHSVTVLDKQYSYLSQSSDATLAPVAAGTVFTLPPAGKANETQYANTVYPTVVLTLAMGSAEVRADVINARGKSIGQVITFPAYWNPRGTFDWNWDGALADGSYAPAGTYKITLKALKIYGNARKPSDWETQTTESFTIKYAKKGKREFTA
ncbi:peptidase S8/S53 domain-containing protein [Sordaria brevicollis]|uniref:Peptidase S8/S53 domain-containing protein n=1 Tax=Sordaria brevicollis TaxID=83679 RepID=A0AAE0P2K2_SORBR|nr:peptidase S8/S53 domain-containing protein [Sordaria brevicollis]